MSSANSKVTSKMKSQPEVRTLKPILPKLDPMVTRVIEINAPPMQMCKCFVCDERVISSGVPLLQSTTQVSNTDLPTKIGQLMGEKFMVVVSADDVLCRKCHALVNHVDKLESDLLLVKRSLRNHLKKKYGLNDDAKETDPLKNEGDVEMEYALIQDVESAEEDQEPRSKKAKVCKPIRFRAIKPKPPGSVQLLKCPSCNFITTESHLLLSHRVVCSAMAYKCTMCDKKFDSPKMIRNHKIEAHLTKWTCHFCNVSFTEEKKFTVHMKNHLGERPNAKARAAEEKKEKLSFKCPHCPASFEAFSQLQIHMVNHRSSVTFKCVRCDIGFQTKQELIEHVKGHEETGSEEYVLPGSPKGEEGTETLYSCPHCSLNFLQEEFYLQHLSLHQDLEGENIFVENGKKEPEFECPNCGERKEDAEALEVHRLTECLGKSGEKAEENAGEETSQLELNQFYVNTGNEAETGDKNGKTVEDILENMFQVKDERVAGGDDEKNRYVCAECSYVSQDLKELKRHFADTHEGVKCWICKKSFDPEELRKHLADEHGAGTVTIPQKTYSCAHCDEKFTNRRALHLHRVKHPENLNVECPDCGEKFAKDKSLNEHREAAHVVCHCRVCRKAFGSVKQLKSHEARHAKSDKTQFKCPECDKIFQTPTGLRHHKAIHTGEFKYKCEFCDKGFVSRVRYEEHRASHTKEERYSCEICGKKFTFQATYWIHRKWHDNPTPYKCVYCGRLFKHSSLLSVHKRKHTGERPYECPHCDQSFTVGNTLKRHLMLHTGVFPFTCQICDQGFSGKHKMALHMSKVHQDNTLLEQQVQKKPSDYKMVVKDHEKTENQTWILTENDNITIKTEEGENIPCALLTDDMIGSNRIVEIIPYDTIRSSQDNEVGFILMNQSERSDLGIVSDEEDFGGAQVYNGECEKGEAAAVGVPVDFAGGTENGCDGPGEAMTEEFVTGL